MNQQADHRVRDINQNRIFKLFLRFLFLSMNLQYSPPLQPGDLERMEWAGWQNSGRVQVEGFEGPRLHRLNVCMRLKMQNHCKYLLFPPLWWPGPDKMGQALFVPCLSFKKSFHQLSFNFWFPVFVINITTLNLLVLQKKFSPIEFQFLVSHTHTSCNALS